MRLADACCGALESVRDGGAIGGDWPDGHDAVQPQGLVRAYALGEAFRAFRRTAVTLRGRNIYLKQHGQTFSQQGRGLCERLRRLDAVDALHHVERGGDLFGLVRLDVPDEMRGKVGPDGTELLEFTPRLLHVILTDIRNAGLHRFVHRVRALQFGNAEDRYVGRDLSA